MEERGKGRESNVRRKKGEWGKEGQRNVKKRRKESGESIIILLFRSYFYLQVILGKVVSHDSILDQDIARAILSCQNDNSFKTVLGGTMCTDDFYEGNYVDQITAATMCM